MVSAQKSLITLHPPSLPPSLPTHFPLSLLPNFRILSGPSSGVMPIPPKVCVNAASVSPSIRPKPRARELGSLLGKRGRKEGRGGV